MLRGLTQKIVPAHILEDIHGKHLRGMVVKVQCLEDLLDGVCFVRVLLE